MSPTINLRIKLLGIIELPRLPRPRPVVLAMNGISRLRKEKYHGHTFARPVNKSAHLVSIYH